MRRNYVIGAKASPIQSQQMQEDVIQSKQPQGDVFQLPIDTGMPIENKAFDAAVAKGGGHFVTVKPTADTYMPVYYSHGKSYAGKVHHKKHKRVGSSSSSESSESDAE